MPIDFAAIAAQFTPRMQRVIKPIALAFERLSEWLKPRAEQMTEIERATRAFPILRFYNEALTAFLDPSQRGTLAPLEPPRSLLESFGYGGRRFLGGFAEIPQAAQEERLIPGFLGGINDLLDAIVAAIDRYRTPTPEMFDPTRPRNFLDIIGQGVLFFRAVGTSLNQIHSLDPKQPSFTSNVKALQQAWGETFGRNSTQIQAGATAVDDRRPAFAQVDDIARQLGLVVLAIPLIGAMLQPLIEATVLRLKLMLLDVFQGIERTIFGLRAQAINLFAVDLLNLSEQAIRFTRAISFIVRDNLRVYMMFGIQYAEQTLDSVKQFLTNFSTWMNQVIQLLQGWLHGMMGFLDTEVVDLVSILGIPTTLGTVLKSLPRLTLRQLLLDNAELLGDILAGAIRAARFKLSINPAFRVGNWISDKNILERMEALEDVIKILTRNSLRQQFLSQLSSSGAFRTPAVDFPNIYEAFFGAGSPPFAAVLQSTRESLEQDITGVLDAGSQLLDGLGASFATAADRAAQLDPRRYHQMAQTSDRLVEQLFGDQFTATQPSDRLAQAFDQALSRGGFELIGQVIPAYVLEMERYWQEQRASDVEISRETSTSPHILSRRQRLGRIETPSLIIRLPGRFLNDALVQETAQQFKLALNGIYRSGLEQHQQALA
jgi:hypothetical protein